MSKQLSADEIALLVFVTTRVREAFDLAQVDALRVDFAGPMPTGPNKGKPTVRVLYVGGLTPQEVIDCVTSAGDLGYVVQSQKFTTKLGVR